MNALQIKSYLIEQPSAEYVAKSTEIRRFALAQSSSGFYDQLVEKIQQSFGVKLLPEKDEIKTYWLDEENEMVCFSTDSELQYAVDLQMALKMSGVHSMAPYDSSIFKVYIVRKECAKDSSKRSKCGTFKTSFGSGEKTSSHEETDDENNNGKLLHPGVVCDGCNGQVVGKRFKCKTCPDYDLCSTCKEKNIHSEHEFVTIERPHLRCPWYMSSGRGSHGRHGWKHWRHHWRNHMQQQQQQQAQQQQQEQQHQQHQQSASAHHAYAQNLNETIRNFMPHIANSIPMVYNQEQLKNVGEYLRQFLDPFGIDVSYYVDNLGGGNGGAAASTSTTTTTTSTSTSTEEKKKEEAAAAATAATKETEENLEKKPTSQEDKMMESEPLIEKPVDSVITSAATSTTSVPVREDLIDLTKLTPSTTTTTTTTNTTIPSAPLVPTLSSPFHAAASALQSVVENPSNGNSDAASVKSATSLRPDQEFNGFNLIDMEKEIKFINCIEQLKNMGYADDGGWLTRLVISKDGNIHAVLDSLHPSKN